MKKLIAPQRQIPKKIAPLAQYPVLGEISRQALSAKVTIIQSMNHAVLGQEESHRQATGSCSAGGSQ
jgi:hypothetical protein